jgi:type I restriction enzyme S subunit
VSDDLPEGWVRARIGDVFGCWGGMTPSTSEAKFWGGSMPWISSKDVKGPVVAGGTECVTSYALAENRLRKCPAGTVLVVVRSGVLVHTLPVAVTSREVVVNQDVKALDSGDRQLNEWAALYLRATQRQILEANRKEGTTVQSIRVPELLDHELAVAPLAEQHRIVAKVEALLEQLRRAKDRLDRVPLILRRFRQAVLAAACEGRLTEEWRRGRLDESAAVMLARSQELRCSRQPKAVAAALAQGRRKPADPVSPIPTEAQVAGLPDLPDRWSWALLPGLGELARGRSRHRPRDAKHLYGGLHPFIQTGDIARSDGRITNHSQTYSDAGLAQSRLWPTGTVAITIAANIANSAVLTYPACFPDSVVGFVAEPDLCLPSYVEFFVRTVRERLAEFAPATAQKNINLETLGEVVVPLPPLAEQAEIVGRVDALFALATAIEQRVERAAARADNLPQAILSKAFAGELVPTEADLARQEGRDYESAEKLIERVRRSPSTPTSDAARSSRPRRRAGR